MLYISGIAIFVGDVRWPFDAKRNEKTSQQPFIKINNYKTPEEPQEITK